MRFIAGVLSWLFGLASIAQAQVFGGMPLRSFQTQPQSIYPVLCSGVDDSVAINAALDLAIASAAVAQRGVGVYFPAGQTCVYKTPHACMTYPISLYGDGPMSSIIRLDPSLIGDVFCWSEVWRGSSTNTPPTIGPNSTLKINVLLSGITVIGNTSSANQQNAFVFYDRVDNVRIEHIECYYVPGMCFSAGVRKNQTQSFLRETTIFDLRAENCGLNTGSVPSVKFYSDGTSDTTNEVKVFNLNIFASAGPGLLIANNVSTKNIGDMDFFGIRVEGIQNSPAGYSGDNIQIGDSSSGGGFGPINMYGVELISEYTGYAGIHLLAPNATVAGKSYEVVVKEIQLGPGTGNGINVQAGKALVFGVLGASQTGLSGTGLIVGPAANGIGAIAMDGYSNSFSGWTTSIDATSASLVKQVTYGSFP